VERSLAAEHRSVALLVAALIGMNSLNCENDRVYSNHVERMAGKTIQQVQEQHTNEWMAIPGVVGTAIGQDKGKPCILILTAANTEQIRKRIPAMVDGYPVVVQYVGEIHALDK
jgi:hypothetical protein